MEAFFVDQNYFLGHKVVLHRPQRRARIGLIPLLMVASIVLFSFWLFTSWQMLKLPDLKANYFVLKTVHVCIFSDRIAGLATTVGSIYLNSATPHRIHTWVVTHKIDMIEEVRKVVGKDFAHLIHGLQLDDVTDQLSVDGYKPVWTWEDYGSSLEEEWKNENTVHPASWDFNKMHMLPLNHLRFYIPYFRAFQNLSSLYFVDDDVLINGDLYKLAPVLNEGVAIVGNEEYWSWNDKCSFFEFRESKVSLMDTSILLMNGRTKEGSICKTNTQKGCVSNTFWKNMNNASLRIQGNYFDPSKLLQWNFGFSLLNLQNWQKANLTGLYEEWMRVNYRLHIFPETSLSYGLGIAQLAFGGHVQVWGDFGIHVRDALGFVTYSDMEVNGLNPEHHISSAFALHWAGGNKPWSSNNMESFLREANSKLLFRLGMKVRHNFVDVGNRTLTILLHGGEEDQAQKFLKLLNQHPNICASGSFPQETLFSVASIDKKANWLSDCKPQKGCLWGFLLKWLPRWKAKQEQFCKIPIIPPARLSLEESVFRTHRPRLCRWVERLNKMHGEFWGTAEIFDLYWQQIGTPENKFFPCLCPAGSKSLILAVSRDEFFGTRDASIFVKTTVRHMLKSLQKHRVKIIDLRTQDLLQRFLLERIIPNAKGTKRVEPYMFLKYIAHMTRQLHKYRNDDLLLKHLGIEVMHIHTGKLHIRPLQVVKDLLQFVGISYIKKGDRHVNMMLNKMVEIASERKKGIQLIKDFVSNSDQVLQLLVEKGYLPLNAPLKQQIRRVNFLVIASTKNKMKNILSLLDSSPQACASSINEFGTRSKNQFARENENVLLPPLKQNSDTQNIESSKCDPSTICRFSNWFAKMQQVFNNHSHICDDDCNAGSLCLFVNHLGQHASFQGRQELILKDAVEIFLDELFTSGVSNHTNSVPRTIRCSCPPFSRLKGFGMIPSWIISNETGEISEYGRYTLEKLKERNAVLIISQSSDPLDFTFEVGKLPKKPAPFSVQQAFVSWTLDTFMINKIITYAKKIKLRYLKVGETAMMKKPTSALFSKILRFLGQKASGRVNFEFKKYQGKHKYTVSKRRALIANIDEFDYVSKRIQGEIPAVSDEMKWIQQRHHIEQQLENITHILRSANAEDVNTRETNRKIETEFRNICHFSSKHRKNSVNDPTKFVMLMPTRQGTLTNWVNELLMSDKQVALHDYALVHLCLKYGCNSRDAPSQTKIPWNDLEHTLNKFFKSQEIQDPNIAGKWQSARLEGKEVAIGFKAYFEEIEGNVEQIVEYAKQENVKLIVWTSNNPIRHYVSRKVLNSSGIDYKSTNMSRVHTQLNSEFDFPDLVDHVFVELLASFNIFKNLKGLPVKQVIYINFEDMADSANAFRCGISRLLHFLGLSKARGQKQAYQKMKFGSLHTLPPLHSHVRNWEDIEPYSPSWFKIHFK